MLKTGAATGTLSAEFKKITDALDPKTQDKLAHKITNAQAGASLDFKDAYTEFETATTDATNLIDKALESNDLTELDTTNLKALRSYIDETKSTFDTALKDSGLVATGTNQNVKQEALDKLKAGLNSAAELGKTSTEKAAATHAFSQRRAQGWL